MIRRTLAIVAALAVPATAVAQDASAVGIEDAGSVAGALALVGVLVREVLAAVARRGDDSEARLRALGDRVDALASASATAQAERAHIVRTLDEARQDLRAAREILGDLRAATRDRG